MKRKKFNRKVYNPKLERTIHDLTRVELACGYVEKLPDGQFRITPNVCLFGQGVPNLFNTKDDAVDYLLKYLKWTRDEQKAWQDEADRRLLRTIGYMLGEEGDE